MLSYHEKSMTYDNIILHCRKQVQKESRLYDSDISKDYLIWFLCGISARTIKLDTLNAEISNLCHSQSQHICKS